MMRFTSNSYKHLQNGRTAFYATLLGFFILLMNLSPVFAGSITVENIVVDVSAANAVQAREKAFEEAQIKGYKILAEKFLSAEELEHFETPDIDTVSIFVKDFEVTKEKLSATRYAGTYKIRYSDKAFSQKNADSAANNLTPSSQQGNVLVLPFFEDAGYSTIWRPNPFMQAWVSARNSNSAAPSIVPLGDTQDISAIRDNQALRYNPANVENLKKRYSAEQAAILMATPEFLSDGTQKISVGIYQAKSYGPELLRQISVRSYPGEIREQLYSRVVNEVNKVFLSNGKNQPVAAQKPLPEEQPLTGPVKVMVAQVNFSTMRQWVDTKRSIERTRGIRSINVKSLSPRSATLMIDYQGGIESLRGGLQQNGIGLNNPSAQHGQIMNDSGTVYQLSPRF